MGRGRIRVYMIGNSHIDPIWLWSWREGYRVVRSTFRNALDLINEFNFFVFTASSAAFYEWIEANEPETFRKIRRRVKEGRWAIVGGWIVEPDCNIPSGESFVRHALYGQRYFKRKFGVTAVTGYNVDSFGHNGMLPQILSKCGLKNYVFMRPGIFENKNIPETAFWWEGYDGSRVLCYRLPLYSTGGGDIADHIDKTVNTVKPPFWEAMCFYGTGDHGGGPTRENILSILRRKGRNDVEIIFSSPDEFFNTVKLRPWLPVFRGEMQHHARGCYSVHSEVKRNNRKAEELLCTAEKIASLAYLLLGREYPQEELTEAWKNLLFTQFHDALGGTSIPEAYEDIRDIHGEVLNRGSKILNRAVQAIASKINTKGEGIPIIVFNPHSWNTVHPVEVEGVDSEGSLIDEKGRIIPMQRIKSSANVGDWRQRIVFIADVPALGYRVYHNISKKDGVSSLPGELIGSDNLLENEWIRLELDPLNGYIKRLYDKKNGVEVFSKDSCIPVVVEDQSDTWSHGVEGFMDDVGTFGNAKVRLVENGPVRATIRVESNYNKSFMYIHVSIYRGLPYVELKFSLNWNEQHKMLKLSFSVNVDQPVLTSSIPYGWVTRPCNGEEEPMNKWIDITGRTVSENGKSKTFGLSICNDCKYSYDAKGPEIRITVLRSPPYAHHQPYKLDPNITYRYIDQGWQDFSLILLPHDGSWKKARVVKLAEEFNSKPVVFVDYPHVGNLPSSWSLIHVDQDNVIISALKKHEDSGNLVMRCFETNGEETETRINLLAFNKKLKARFKPFEIKTFLIPKAAGRIRELDMLEFPRRK